MQLLLHAGVVYVLLATHPQDQYYLVLVVYGVDNTPPAGEPDPKDVLAVSQLSGSSRTRVLTQGVDELDGLGADMARQLPDLALRWRRDLNPVAHQLPPPTSVQP